MLNFKYDSMVVFHKDGNVSTINRDNSSNFDELFQKNVEAYRAMSMPLGLLLFNKSDETAYGMCFDIDRHSGKEVVPESIVNAKLDSLLPLLSKFNYAIEDSVGGFKVWVTFKYPVDAKVVFKFQKYVSRKIGIEAYPFKKNPIRLPGLYKDYTRFSTTVDGQVLDTWEKVEAFLKKAENFSFPDGLVEEDSLEPDNKAFLHREASIYDKYFPLIWEYVTGTPMPEIDTQIKCPFHEDNKPSARLKYHIHIPEKIVFFCNSENCEMSTSKDVKIRDAQDLLTFYNKSSKDLLEVLDNIVFSLFAKYRYIKKEKISLNYITLSDDIDIKVERDENSILYTYNGLLWEPVSNPKLEDDICYSLVTKELEKKVSKYGVWHLGRRGIDEVTNLVMKRKLVAIKAQNIGQKEIPYRNGIYSLETGAIRKIKKEDYLLHTLDCNYNPIAVNEKWTKLLDLYLPEKESQMLLQEYVGAALLPDLQVGKILFCYGSGGNGKGTLLNIIQKIFSKLCSNLSLNDVGDRFRAYDLFGKYLNIDSDASGAPISGTVETNLKTITGDGPVYIERKFAQPFSYRVRAKFIVACNKIPSMGEINESITRRFLELPFTQKVPKENFGGFWETIVATEEDLSGINNWILEGLKRYLKVRKFTSISSEEEVKSEYFKESDPVYGYIVSLFETDLNDNSKYNHKLGNFRLTNAQFKSGVSMGTLFKDFMVYSEQCGITYKMTLNKFTRVFNNHLSDSSLKEDYKKKIKKARLSSGISVEISI